MDERIPSLTLVLITFATVLLMLGWGLSLSFQRPVLGIKHDMISVYSSFRDGRIEVVVRNLGVEEVELTSIMIKDSGERGVLVCPTNNPKGRPEVFRFGLNSSQPRVIVEGRNAVNSDFILEGFEAKVFLVKADLGDEVVVKVVSRNGFTQSILNPRS